MSSDKGFLVVGIGASAGGVEAFEGFFRKMPADTGMAFVLVTHMPPGYETTLPEILARYTDMPVSGIRDNEAIEPDHVYVCPSAHVVAIKDGLFSLASRQSGHERKPIDIFLSSLAVALSENAIGVVLSGGGSDGALGIRAIKLHGGLTLAQGTDGSGPRQTSMPEAAIATGVVDLVLPVEDMAARLVEFARSRRDDDDASMPAQQDVGGAPESPELRRQIAQLLHVQVGHDFSGYKEKSFMRRVRRRMQILQLSDLAAYVQRLEKEPEEVKLLFRDLLIGVTNFFRDEEAFDALKEQVIPKLFEGLGAADSVRIWVPGCATGEEAYSIAILVREHMQSLKAIPTVQIFATDIDDAALTVARRGRYPQALMENLAPERLARFFVRDDVSYTVVKELRDLCIFSLHSVLRDPPFSRIDLISCRNLLIYLGNEFQGRVIPIFHVALRPRGYLFLGTSESISQYSDLFQRIDNKQRLFQRRDHVSSPFPLTFGPGARAAVGGIAVRREPSATASGLRAAVESRVMESFAPPHVAVNRDGDIVHYSSRTGRYLEAAAGMPSRQLLASARRGLRLDLRHAFQEALESRRPAVREGVAVEIDGHIQTVRITVEPIGTHESDPLFLVIFSDVGRPQLPAEMAAGRRGGDGSVEQLERELRETRDRLQVTVEEYEASLEEMKSGNEEMVSVNEELQSTNEELETSKEELQSVNEELQTVNSELNSKVEELDRANADLRNLFETTQVGTIFLDNELVIRSFTPAATSVFNLISTDRGRPLTDIVSRFDYDGFEREIRSVLERGETIERRVHRSDGKTHYLMRILPYRGRNNVTEGVVVTFFDVTRLVEAEEQQRTLMEELNHRVRNMLTVVTAIAQAAHARSESPEHFITSFTARIRAMAATYSLLSRQNWGDVGLRNVVEAVIEPYRRNNEDRFKLEGPAVLLKPKAVLAFGLVAHELTANAAKYGALSNDKGTISIDWQQEAGDAGALLLRWREANGPAVKKPSRKGLGSELIEREIKNMLRGTAAFDYAPAGLEVVLSMPAAPSTVADSPVTSRT